MGAIIVGLLVMVANTMRQSNATASGRIDDLKVIQDIQRGMARLEKRVEALETLLLDNEGRGGKA